MDKPIYCHPQNNYFSLWRTLIPLILLKDNWATENVHETLTFYKWQTYTQHKTTYITINGLESTCMKNRKINRLVLRLELHYRIHKTLLQYPSHSPAPPPLLHTNTTQSWLSPFSPKGGYESNISWNILESPRKLKNVWYCFAFKTNYFNQRDYRMTLSTKT